MLENVKNGDIIICKSGYTFTWYNHTICNGMIGDNRNILECYIKNVALIKNDGVKPLNNTLEFLKQQTGLDFEFSRGKIRYNGFDVYDVKEKECRLIDKKIIIKDRYITWPRAMEPSEFIEKIAKGEWV